MSHVAAAIVVLTCVAFVMSMTPRAAVATLADGVTAEWGLGGAHRETTPTRERVSVNGLWEWRPAETTPATGEATADATDVEAWGHVKVPAPWPGSRGNYMWRQTQTHYPGAAWADADMRAVDMAWYRREITVPADWGGRRVTVAAETVNSYAAVYVDARRVGEIHFPGGEADITASVSPGATHTLSLFVAAMPLHTEIAAYSNSSEERRIRGTVALRGLCGDVWLVSSPASTRISGVAVTTSVARGEITLDVEAIALSTDEVYQLSARITGGKGVVEAYASEASPHADGRLSITHAWRPDKLWDTHTPENTYEVEVSLLNASGDVIDTWPPVRFGFREFVIDGPDLVLNGKRVHLFAVPLDNAQISAAAATYDGARETLTRLQSWGVNAVYTHNYGCQPGTHLGFNDILRAADDVGMLVGFSQPHFSHYEWDADDADATNGYADHAAFYVRAARNHPSVVMYSMSHNATGYSEDMNPDMMDGVQSARDQWAERNARKARRAAEIVHALDPSRIVYHHAGGNIGPLHSSNFYLNFAPIQERSDWFERWSRVGVKPLVLWEYGVPWDLTWSTYRGWHNGERDFGGAAVPWQLTMAEWNAQFLGDRAFDLAEEERENLRFEAKKWRAGETWHRWDYPNRITGRGYADKEEVWALYIADNWRAFRTWGLSGFNAWGYGNYWARRDGADGTRRDLPVAWEALQRPGFSPDYVDAQYERMDTAYDAEDWEPLAPARALLRNNQPLLAYIAGAPGRFTEKGHNFVPGARVEKQIVVINDSRETVVATCSWTVALPRPVTGSAEVVVDTGDQARLPILFTLPEDLRPGAYAITATVTFSTGEPQTDALTVDVLAHTQLPRAVPAIALFDPVGESAAALSALGVAFEEVDAGADLTAVQLVIVGRRALTLDGPAPDLTRVRDGLRVLMLEQSSDVLEKRLGFRVQEYGLRDVFPRVADHAALRHLRPEHLRNWQGEATLLPPRLDYTLKPRLGPTVTRSGLEAPRAWRAGSRGNVASVLIEKPGRGDFLSILDGGFGLQYSALLEYHEGDGVIVFCQMDVTGRTIADPAAGLLLANLVAHVAAYQAAPSRAVTYVGEDGGASHLASAGYALSPYAGSAGASDHVLLLGPGASNTLADVKAVARWNAAGGRTLAAGIDATELTRLMPFEVTTRRGEYVAASFDPFAAGSAFVGVGPGETHIREPRALDLLVGEAARAGGLLGVYGGAVLCQIAPWQFDHGARFNLKMPYRRSSHLLARLLGAMGVRPSTPLLDRFASPVAEGETRWLEGLYLDIPVEMDDPYRFFRW